MDKDLTQITKELQPEAESSQQAVTTYATEKTREAETMAGNLNKPSTSGMGIVNLIIAGLIVGIPAYIGAGMGLDYVAQHAPFLTETTKNMIRMGTIFGMRPALGKLTNLLSGKVLNPVSDTLSKKVQDVRNRQTAQDFINNISVPQRLATAPA